MFRSPLLINLKNKNPRIIVHFSIALYYGDFIYIILDYYHITA